MDKEYILALAFLAFAFLVAGVCFGFGTSCDPIPWKVAYETSSCLSPMGLFYLRVALALVFVYAVLLSVAQDWENGYWLMYLTRLALLVETAFFVALAIIARPAAFAPQYQKLPEIRSDGAVLPAPEPAGFPLVMVLSTISLPVSVAVVLMYWTLVEPVWNLCVVDPKEGCKATPSALTIFNHFINMWLILFHFLVSRIPFKLSNAGWYLAAVTLYSLWTLIHYALRIGIYPGDTCKNYTDPKDCPIYDAIDWHNPTATLQLLAIVWLVLGVGLMLLCRAVDVVRDCADPALAGLSNPSLPK